MPEQTHDATTARGEATEPRVQREVVSFVRRSSRMNASQAKAWQRLHERWVVPVRTEQTTTSVAADQRLALDTLFGRRAPLTVEIGSGNGESLVAMAALRPDHNVLAFEVFEPQVASTLSRLDRHGVDNVRIVPHDAQAGLEHLLGPDSIDELWIFFADPWHKTRHHKRRLIGPEFAALIATRLVPGGVLRLATDWEDYALWMREVLDATAGLTNEHPGDWAPRLADRPVTRFEQRGLDAGRTIHDLTYRRLP